MTNQMTNDAIIEAKQTGWEYIDAMVKVLWNLTPQELCRLSTVHADKLTEKMLIAISVRVDEANRFTYDHFDCPTFRGNEFVDYCRNHPVYGPQEKPADPMAFDDEDLPF